MMGTSSHADSQEHVLMCQVCCKPLGLRISSLFFQKKWPNCIEAVAGPDGDWHRLVNVYNAYCYFYVVTCSKALEHGDRDTIDDELTDISSAVVFESFCEHCDLYWSFHSYINYYSFES
jgi:hypothetical protein